MNISRQENVFILIKNQRNKKTRKSNVCASNDRISSTVKDNKQMEK